MQNRSVVVLAGLFALSLVACGGAAAETGVGEKNPWADFKGTYSTPGEGTHAASDKTDKADGSKAHKDAKAKAEPKEEAAEENPAPAPAAKKASRGTVKGESLSSVSVDTLTDVSKASLKQKLVSNSVITGDKYEVVNVQLKTATVQITRPASTPVATGPAVKEPKAKSGELTKNDASWYDEDADVLVVVTAGKKAAAQKALNSIVKGR